jgi:hypothetical protein
VAREPRPRTSEPLFATGDLLRLPDPALARRPFLLDLNLQTSNRLSVALAALLALLVVLLPFPPGLWPLLLLPAAALLALNWQLYRFLAQRRAGFTLAAIPGTGCTTSITTCFGVGTLLLHARRAPGGRRRAARPNRTRAGRRHHAHPPPTHEGAHAAGAAGLIFLPLAVYVRWCRGWRARHAAATPHFAGGAQLAGDGDLI